MGSHVHKGIWEAYGRTWDPMGGHGRQSGTGSVLRVMGTAPPFTSHGMPRCPSASHVPPMGTQAMGTPPSGTSHGMPWLPSFSHERPMGSQLCLVCCAAPTCADAAGL